MSETPPPGPAPQRTGTTRINVDAGRAGWAAIELVRETEGVGTTEATRILLGYGAYLYNAVKIAGEPVYVGDPQVKQERVTLL